MGWVGGGAYKVVAHLIRGVVSQEQAFRRRDAEGVVWQTLSFSLMREIGRQLAMDAPNRVEPGVVGTKRPRPLPHHHP